MATTKKQVISGYHRPVCPECQCELHPETNSVGVVDMAEWGEYELYDADLWKCPKCGKKVIGGFGYGAISRHFADDFKLHLEHYSKQNKLYKNYG